MNIDSVDVNLEQVSVRIEPVRWFWSKRQGETRNLLWFLAILNLIFKLVSVVTPFNESDRNSSLCELVVTVIVIVLLACSYKARDQGTLICVALCIYATLDSVYLLNFHGKKHSPEKPDDPSKESYD